MNDDQWESPVKATALWVLVCFFLAFLVWAAPTAFRAYDEPNTEQGQP